MASAPSVVAPGPDGDLQASPATQPSPRAPIPARATSGSCNSVIIVLPQGGMAWQAALTRLCFSNHWAPEFVYGSAGLCEYVTRYYMYLHFTKLLVLFGLDWRRLAGDESFVAALRQCAEIGQILSGMPQDKTEAQWREIPVNHQDKQALEQDFSAARGATPEELRVVNFIHPRLLAHLLMLAKGV